MQTSDTAKPDAILIDALGQLCPLPVLKLAKLARAAKPGQALILWADDPMARVDVPHFCAQQGLEFAGETDLPDEAPKSHRADHARAYHVLVPPFAPETPTAF